MLFQSTPILNFNCSGRVVPADALSSGNFTLGFSNRAVTLPAGYDVLYSKEFAIAASGSHSMNMESLQIATIDATAPLDADGEAMELDTVYALAFVVKSVGDSQQSFAFKAVNNAWTHELGVQLTAVGDYAAFAFKGGITVGSSDTITLSETGGNTSVTVEMVVIGKNLVEPSPSPSPESP